MSTYCLPSLVPSSLQSLCHLILTKASEVRIIISLFCLWMRKPELSEMCLSLRSRSQWQDDHSDPKCSDSGAYALKHHSIWIRKLRHREILGTHSQFSNEDLITQSNFSWTSIQDPTPLSLVKSKRTLNREEPAPLGNTLYTISLQQITQPCFLRDEWRRAASFPW